MKQENIAWIDLLRVASCVLVVLAHSCDPFVARFDSNYNDFLSGVLWGSFCRPCVPLFVMISGVLLLPIKMDMNAFYKKRITKVVIPLFIWSVVTPILFTLYLTTIGASTSSPNIVLESHTWSTALNKILSFPFNFNYDITPLWYLYMLVGIYLILPIISAWVTQASKKELKIFLGLWILTTILPYIQMIAPSLGYQGNYGNMGILGICDWNPYGTFHYFSGFLGYVILAYYLIKFPLEWSWKKTLSLALPLWALGYTITSMGFLLTQKYFPGNYAELEIVWYFSGVNVLMMTFSTFIIMQKIPVRPSPLLSKLASLTFGIYLTHFLVVLISYDFIYPYVKVAPALQIPLVAILALTLTTAIVWILSKLPIRKYLIG